MGLILSLLRQRRVQGVYNGVAQTRMSRQCFYQQAALALALPEPGFNEQTRGIMGKRINDDKTREVLSYLYQHDDLVLWMENNED